MVLWDYGGETGALIGTSTFAPAVAYWAPASGAGGNGTWTNSNAYWTTDAAGLTTKQPWTSGVGVAYFGGVSGTVSVGENVNVNQIYFTTGGYVVQGGGGGLVYGNGGTITAESGTATVSATQTADSGLKIAAGNGTVVLQGTTNLGWTRTLLVDGGKLVMNGTVNSPIGNGFVYLSGGSLSGTGTINNAFGGSGLVSPGPSGTSSGILTATQLNPTDGVDFSFVFSGTSPNYANAADSVNDLVRLTGGTPFSAGMTAANVISVFFNDITATTLEEIQALTGDKWTGGFFTNESALFSASVVNATFRYYIYGDGNGTYSINGTNYYSLRDIDPEWTRNFSVGTEATVANFAGGSDAGQIMTFTMIVPEPGTIALAITGAAYATWGLRRRRRRT